eukprot:GHVU01046735.1.p1 GENE.GHVU01046735.1~~GHVU01046735.1.p1  ORF type:complete len:122 (-),score=4.42 GHVU01046735.1:143-508(-)
MDTFVNPLKNSMKNMGNMVKSMPDNLVDGMVKVSGGIRSLPNSMLDNMGKVLNVRGVSIFVLLVSFIVYLVNSSVYILSCQFQCYYLFFYMSHLHIWVLLFIFFVFKLPVSEFIYTSYYYS